MTDDMRGNPQLLEEYENTFDSEEKISQAVKVTKEEFTIETGVVDFDDILVPDSMKKSRKDTYLGLATSIGEMGILEPIHVMITEGYADWVESGGKGKYEGFRFILMDGFRRIWGGYKNGLTRCNAMIWNFKDKDKGNDVALTLSLILNKNQKKSWGEIWYLYQILETQTALTPGTLEYLLSLRPGEAMKLKDIMSCEYSEVKDELLSDKKTIDQAYNMLQKLRKEEDILTKEDNRGIADLEQAEGIAEKAGDMRLSDDDIKEILEMDEDLELTSDNFDEMLEVPVEVQSTDDRHPLDAAKKAESLLHDGYKCVCCGIGEHLPMRYKLSILQSHHKISVANGGPDDVKNLATLCQNCHTVVHCLLWSGLKFGIGKETFDELPEEEKTKFVKIMKIAQKDWEAGRRRGKSAEQIMGENKHYSQFKMPGTDQAQNRDAVREYNKQQALKNSETA